jgi:hypothetical protein
MRVATSAVLRFFWAMAILASLLCAQSRFGAIYGVVSDTSGGVVPNAKVTATDQATNLVQEVLTSAEGRYQFPLLPIGRYTVRAAVSGFKTGEVKDLTLEIGDKREINFTLSPAAVGESVTVAGEAVEIERSTSALGQVIHQQQVINLPLNGRNFVQLATLAPGITKGEGDFFNGRSGEVSIRGSVAVGVQGMRENTNDWLIDGVDNNELTAGAVSILPSLDSVEEFKLLTYNYSAEYGARGGATVLITTKRGSNAFHGSLFEFLRNDHLDAANFFDNANRLRKGKYNQNQFGGSLGGPIIKDRTFFFGDIQQTYIRQGLTFVNTVPTLAMRRGDFTGLPAIYDPASLRTVGGVRVRDQFANNVIPTNRLNPVAQRLLAFYPDPILSGVAGNYPSGPVQSTDARPFNVRVDHNLTEKDTLFVRYSDDDATRYQPAGLPGFGGGAGTFLSNININTLAHNVALSHTRTFSPASVNTFTAGFNRVFNHMTSAAQGRNVAQEIGIPGANLGDFATSGLTNIFIAGGFNVMGDRGYTPFIGGTNIWHYSDSFSHVRGRHTFKMGGVFRAMQMNVLGITRLQGAMSFDGLYTAGFNASNALISTTGHGVASVLMGLPASGARSNMYTGYITGRRWKEYRGYFEDSWRTTPNLTLNLGIAYSVTTPQTEAADRQTNFDMATGQFINARSGDKYAGVATDFSNVQPRFGFAWSPRGDKKTAIRGGYGIFHDVSANGGVQGLYQNPPYAAEPSWFNDNVNPTPALTLSGGFPNFPQPSTDTYTGNLWIYQRDFQQGIIQQWNLNVQRDLPINTVLTVAYAGTRATHIQTKGFNLNTATPGTGNNPADRRRFARFGNINSILSRGQLTYHALQVKAERRMSQGLYALLSYTWSKALGDGGPQSLSFQGAANGIRYFPLKTWEGADKGLTDTDHRHQATLSWLYDLPFGKGKKWGSGAPAAAQWIIGNWQLNGINKFRTGFPLAMSVVPSVNGTALGNRPNRVCDGTLGSGARGPNRWFDTACFEAPATGVMGNSARTTNSGPGLSNFDFSVFKSFPIRETVNVQFRTEVFNLFNTAQFDLPNTARGNVLFGRITRTINTSRLVQFALKVTF